MCRPCLCSDLRFLQGLISTGEGAELRRALFACTRMFVFFGIGANGGGGAGGADLLECAVFVLGSIRVIDANRGEREG